MGDRLYNSNAFCIFPKETKMSDFVYFLYESFSSDVFLSHGKLQKKAVLKIQLKEN